MARERTYRDLVAWQKGMRLVNDIYRATKTWPPEERFGLTNQVRRAAVSIPANLAEGQGRMGKAELRHHVSIAHGSLCELETLLLAAADNGISDTATSSYLVEQADEVGRLLRGLLRSLDSGSARELAVT